MRHAMLTPPNSERTETMSESEKHDTGMDAFADIVQEIEGRLEMNELQELVASNPFMADIEIGEALIRYTALNALMGKPVETLMQWKETALRIYILGRIKQLQSERKPHLRIVHLEDLLGDFNRVAAKYCKVDWLVDWLKATTKELDKELDWLVDWLVDWLKATTKELVKELDWLKATTKELNTVLANLPS